MTVQEQQALAVAFCKANLLECCVELLQWNDTKRLREGKVRELCGMLDFAGYSALAVAEELVKLTAMERLVSSHIGKTPHPG